MRRCCKARWFYKLLLYQRNASGMLSSSSSSVALRHSFFLPRRPSSSLSQDAPQPTPRRRAFTSHKASLELCRNDWLAALSPPQQLEQLARSSESELGLAAVDSTLIGPPHDVAHGPSGACVLGIDPDVSGAVAVLWGDDINAAEVFDVPNVQVMVGGKQRNRHDARSIVNLINKVKAPSGSVAYIEQSIPFPKDGKQGWWGTGFGFGVWIGILVASGFSVVPVPPQVWKRAMDLSLRTKDECRASAASIFPLLAPQLKRKKDHGRAEALLIAAYGKGIPAPVKEITDNGRLACEQILEVVS